MKCPRCQTENAEGTKFCINCGFMLPLPQPSNHPQNTSFPGNQGYSQNSSFQGNQGYSQNSSFQGNQGYPKNPSYTGNPNNPRQSSSAGAFFSKVFSSVKTFWKKISLKIRIIAIAVLILLIGLIITALFYFSPPHFSKGNLADNMSKFGISADNLSPVTKEYTKLVTFTVLDQGKENNEKGWIVLRVGVPNVTEALNDILYADGMSLEGSTDEEMRESMQKYIAEKLHDGQYEYQYEVFRLDLEHKGFEWKIVPSEQLSDYIYQPVYTAYKEALMQRFAQNDPPDKTVPGEEQEENQQDDENDDNENNE